MKKFSDDEFGDLAIIAEEVVDAQADLQNAIGFYRLGYGDRKYIEDRMIRTEARLHRLLAALGRPMAHPATHPDIPWIECDHHWAETNGIFGRGEELGAYCRECGLVGDVVLLADGSDLRDQTLPDGETRFGKGHAGNNAPAS